MTRTTRISTTIGLMLGLIFVTYPWGSGFAPESSFWRGPLWLLKTSSAWDGACGVIATACCILMVIALAIRPSVATLVTAIAGILIWLGIGAAVAASAAA